MKAPDPFEWEISKENVVPRRGGRSVNELNLALANIGNLEYDRQIKMKQREFECKLRTYNGDDPLNVYCQYCSWMEEHFPTGPNSVIKDLYELTVNTFIKDSRYSNDQRYVNVWLNFVKICPNIAMKLEKFNIMFHYGIGTMCASFYLNWAYYLEEMGNTKRAMEVLHHGELCNAMPVEKIKEKIQYLGSRVCRSISNTDEEFDFFSSNNSDSSRQSIQSRTQLVNKSNSTVKPLRSLPTTSLLASSSRESQNLGVLNSVSKDSRPKKTFVIPDFSIKETPSMSVLLKEGRSATFDLPNCYKKDQENCDNIQKWHETKLSTPMATPASSSSFFEVFNDNQPSTSKLDRICLSSKKGLSLNRDKEDKPDEESDGVKYMFDINMLYGGLLVFNFEMCKAAYIQSKKDSDH